MINLILAILAIAIIVHPPVVGWVILICLILGAVCVPFTNRQR